MTAEPEHPAITKCREAGLVEWSDQGPGVSGYRLTEQGLAHAQDVFEALEGAAVPWANRDLRGSSERQVRRARLDELSRMSQEFEGRYS